MDVTVNVDNISLDSVVHAVYGDGDFGGRYETTLGEAVARILVEKLIRDRAEDYKFLTNRIFAIRDEEIRKAITPVVEAGMEATFQRTSHYGEPHGPAVTMREIIMDELKRALTQPSGNSYDYAGNTKHTLVQKIVADMVKAEFTKIIDAAVKTAKQEVADQIGGMVSAAVANAMKR